VAADIGVGGAATGENRDDATRHAVRFWGHDSAIEASFFIDEEALA